MNRKWWTKLFAHKTHAMSARALIELGAMLSSKRERDAQLRSSQLHRPTADHATQTAASEPSFVFVYTHNSLMSHFQSHSSSTL